MDKHLRMIWFVIALLIIIVAGTVLVLRSKASNNLPENAIRLDQLNIQTRNPQPAGKNITD